MLLKAAESFDINRIKSTIALGADVNVCDRLGRTPLHLVTDLAYAQDSPKTCLPIIKLLINSGCDVNAKDNLNNTALHYTAIGNYDATKLLLEAKANFNSQNERRFTPLMQSLQKKQSRILSLLLSYGADVNLNDDAGQNALICISQTNRPDNFKKILELTTNIDTRDNLGWSALMYATKKEMLTNIKALLQAGANIHLKDINGSSAYDLAKRKNKPSILSVYENHLLNNNYLKEICSTICYLTP